jgi:uncharacterized protein
MASHQFTIPAGELDAAGRQYLFPVRAAWIRGVLEDGEATAAGPDGELDVRASKSGNDVVIHGTLRAELQAPCARCLEPVQLHIDHPVSVLMVPTSHQGPSPRAKSGVLRRASAEAAGEEYEFAAEEADTLPYDGQTVLLDDLVRDELVLDVPMIPLCSDDCPGIRPPPELAVAARGTDDADEPPSHVDPRLLPLLRFQSKVKKE